MLCAAAGLHRALAALALLVALRPTGGAGLRGAVSSAWMGKASTLVAGDLEQLLDDRLLSKAASQTHGDLHVDAGFANSSGVGLTGTDVVHSDIARLQRVARAIDTNNDTHLSLEEMQSFAEALKEQQRWQQTSAALRSADLDGSGDVSLGEVQALAGNSSRELAAHQERCFHAADANADGVLSASELHEFLHPQINESVFSLERDYQFALFDVDRSGAVDFEEFCRGARLHGDEDFDEEAAREDFDLHDHGADGRLGPAEFGRLLSGHDLLMDSITKAIAAGDGDGDGRIHVDLELPTRLQQLLESEFVEDFFFHAHASRSDLWDEL